MLRFKKRVIFLHETRGVVEHKKNELWIYIQKIIHVSADVSKPIQNPLNLIAPRVT